MSLTVKYYDMPDGAQDAAEVEATESQAFSNPATIAIGQPVNAIATLESGVWLLDGTRVLAKGDGSNIAGWWSTRCSNQNGQFTTPPVILINFAAPYTATGLTFFFAPATEQWCSHIRITWYSGSTELDSAEAFPDSAHFVLIRLVEGFNKIKIELLATNMPNNYAKIQLVQIGQELWFEGDELVSVQLLNEVDPTLCELSVDTMVVNIQNKHERTLVPQQNQRMDLYRDDKLLATQYITETRRESKWYYQIECQSAIGMLEDTFLGGLYSGVSLTTMLDIVLEGMEYYVDPVFSGETITGYLPSCTRREALQQIAFAIGAVVTTQKSSVINLLPLDTAGVVTSAFEECSIFPDARVNAAARLYSVKVVAHGYTPSEEEVLLIDAEEVGGTGVLYVFDQPHHSYSITGGVITESGVNYAIISASGTVTLTAKMYTHTTKTLTKKNPEALASERNNSLTVGDVTLIHSGNAKAALERLYTATLYRHVLNQNAVVGDDQYAGQFVASPNPWERMTYGYIASMDSTMTQNKRVAAMKIIGVERDA